MIERFALGTPLSIPDRDAPGASQVAPRPTTMLLGRAFLATIFLLSGFMKFVAYDATVSYAEAAGLPWPEGLIVLGAVVEILGGLSLLLGFLTRIGALGLSVYLVLTAFIFHDYWNFTDAQQQLQMAHFFKNLTIIGGMLLLIASGAGPYSIDRLIFKRLHDTS